MRDNRFALKRSACVAYCVEAPPDLDKYLIREGDLLISRTGSIGVNYLVSNPEPAVFASYLIRFQPKESVTIPLPPLAEQSRIVMEVDRRLSLVRGVEAEVDVNLKRALALRQSTMHKALRARFLQHV